MKFIKNSKSILGTIIISILILVLLYPGFFIVIQTTETLSLHYLLPGEKFTITYIHSVEKTPVDEIYRMIPYGKLEMTETRFKSYGAGLPLETKNFSSIDGMFVIKDMDIVVPIVNIRVARTPGQTINLREKRYYLQQLSPPGTLVTIRPISLLEYLLILTRPSFCPITN